MIAAMVLLVMPLTFFAGRLSLYRTVKGQELELEGCRQHVDMADTAIDVRTRGWRSALALARRYRRQLP